MAGAEYYNDLLKDVFSGRRVVVCSDSLVGGSAVTKTLLDLGALRPLIVAGSRGTGTIPPDDESSSFVVGTSGDDLMAAIRAYEDALREPPAAMIEAIERYDPDGSALVLGTLFSRSGTFLGREVFGGRPREWEALEDKMVIDEVFDAAGIGRAPSEVVAADVDTMCVASARLDAGLGTAWAGDAREGWWGGGAYLRWVRSAEDADEATGFFAEHCNRVRIMPFLDGIPCSIHGMVFDDAVAAFRPVEMLTLRRPEANQLLYSGLATFWDPPDAGRHEMRAAARKLGALLRERVDYRGMFTLDGVMTSEGFRPTEVNTRAGAGIGPQSGASGVNLGLISNLAARKTGIDFRPAELEALVVEAADAKRSGACYTVYPQKREATEIHPVLDGPDGFALSPHNDDPDGQIFLGPSGVGGFVRYTPDPPKVAKGPSFAPTAVRAFAFTDETFGTDLGPLEAAREAP